MAASKPLVSETLGREVRTFSPRNIRVMPANEIDKLYTLNQFVGLFLCRFVGPAVFIFLNDKSPDCVCFRWCVGIVDNPRRRKVIDYPYYSNIEPLFRSEYIAFIK